MATITYGKGKTLRPTPAAALRETIAQNVRSGRVEMLDIPTQDAGKANMEAGNRLQSVHGGMRAAKNTLAHLRQGGESSERSQGAGQRQRKDDAVTKSKEVRVRIHAPDVVQFFTSKKHDELVVVSEEHLPE